MAHDRRRRCAAILVVCLIAAGAVSCRSRSGDIAGTSTFLRHTAARDALGARFRVTGYAPPTVSQSAVIAEAFERLDELDRILNPDRADSEISTLAATAGGSGARVSDDLFAVLQQGQRLSGVSRGAFDLTAGPYTDLWRRAAAAGRVPSQAELEDARLRVGWEKLRLDTIERTATLTVADMRLDPAGIARGYAADQVMRQLRLHGLERARVEVGNVVLVGAAPPGSEGWTVGLRNVPGPREPRTVTLADAAIAFSPGTRPSASRNARRNVPPPLISPTNGRPVPPVAVVVVSRHAAHAQSVATAAAVLGPDAGESLSRNVRARIRFGGKPSAAGAGGR